MKQSLVFVVVAIGAGVLGGAMFGHSSRSAPRPESPPIERPEPHPPLVIVPPGWDATLTDRVAALEHRLDRPQRSDDRPPDPSSQSQPGSDREAERVAQYQKELEYRTRSLADHDGEPLDSAWAGTESDQIRRDFARKTSNAGARSVELKAVDCRSKTCTAELSFPTPVAGLGFIQQGPATLAVPGCNGFSSVPPPPTGDGRYEVTVLYTCR